MVLILQSETVPVGSITHFDPLIWPVFAVIVVVMLAIDLWVFHRKTTEIKLSEALLWSGIWTGLALVFNIVVFVWLGKETAVYFFTGYLIERALSIDNLFVFWIIFSYFHVPARFHNGILFWGIIGALLIRAVFIVAGIALIDTFHWVIYVFGAFLIYTGIRMAFRGDEPVHPENNPVVKFAQRILPIATDEKSGAFFTRRNGKRMATPLLLVLITIAVTDVVFALDSVPAILAITRDLFIVYSSNVFAVLGLRALYFALAGLVPLFRYLEYGLAIVLVFVGIKMLDIIKVPVEVALGVIAFVVLGSIVLSLLIPPKLEDEGKTPHSFPADDHH